MLSLWTHVDLAKVINFPILAANNFEFRKCTSLHYPVRFQFQMHDSGMKSFVNVKFVTEIQVKKNTE